MHVARPFYLQLEVVKETVRFLHALVFANTGSLTALLRDQDLVHVPKVPALLLTGDADLLTPVCESLCGLQSPQHTRSPDIPTLLCVCESKRTLTVFFAGGRTKPLASRPSPR